MPTNEKYAEEIQKLGMGAEIILYEIDLSVYDGPTLYLVPTSYVSTDHAVISFGGQEYESFPISSDGFEWVAGQAPPQPTVTVSNIDHALTAYVLQYSNLIGCKFTRIRTFERFLDDGEEPDGTAHMPKDIYRIDKKTGHTEKAIEWELASWIDQQGVMLPKRMVIRDYCDLRYRIWNEDTLSFDYSKATCPYTEEGTGNMFDRLNNAVVDGEDDVCQHTLRACRLRFGENANLPFGGFPGCAKFRI